MDERWLELEGPGGGTRKIELGAGLTRIGGRTADVVLFDSLAGELHLWDSPPKLVNIGGDSEIRLNGKAFEEEPLADGDRVQWGESKLVFRCKSKPPVLEEVRIEPSRSASVRSTTGEAVESRVSQRVLAGLIAELGLANKAVMNHEFDVDACARELLEASDVAPEDPRLLERSGRLTRDLVMAPLQRGVKSASRRAKGAAKSGAAFLVAQLIVVGIFSLMVLILMVVVHVKWPEFSFDEFLGKLVPGGES